MAVTELVAVDIGGTHARFALARVEGGRVIDLAPERIFGTGDWPSLEAAWRELGRKLGRPLPNAAAIAVAAPVSRAELKLTNSHWSIRPAELPAKLGLDRLTLVNDFGAVAHAVAQLGPEHLRPLCGPPGPLPETGVISILGPGTGLGVALLLRRNGSTDIIETEGGHIGFAPVDTFEDDLLCRLRERHSRVSVERVVSGSGLVEIHGALGGSAYDDARTLWSAALGGSDPLAAAALDRFCRILGSVSGDIALAHGASAVIVAGGLGLRLADHLPRSGFAERFVEKGRFAAQMARLPVRILTYPQPGLLGAAAAFAVEHAGIG